MGYLALNGGVVRVGVVVIGVMKRHISYLTKGVFSTAAQSYTARAGPYVVPGVYAFQHPQGKRYSLVILRAATRHQQLSSRKDVF